MLFLLLIAWQYCSALLGQCWVSVCIGVILPAAKQTRIVVFILPLPRCPVASQMCCRGRWAMLGWSCPRAAGERLRCLSRGASPRGTHGKPSLAKLPDWFSYLTSKPGARFKGGMKAQAKSLILYWLCCLFFFQK